MRIPHFVDGALRWVGFLILPMFILLWLAAVPALAQDAAAGDEAPAEDGEDAGPGFPSGLDNLSMEFEDFQLRLIPLTASELSALAARLQEVARAQTEAVVEATIAARQKDGGAPQEDLNAIVALTETRAESFDRFAAVVTNLERKGGDEAEVAAYRAYRRAVVVEEKQRADWQTLVTQAVSWAKARDGGLGVLIDVAVVVASFLGILAVARIIRAYSKRLIGRVPNLSKLLQAFLAMTVYWLAIAVGLMVVLSALGVDISPIFALVGGASFILAFAMQDTLGNLASGLMIMLNHPFDEGDFITAAGTSGTVKSVSVVSTTVTTPDNQVIVIPNSKVWGDVITNVTASPERRLDLEFGIDYGDDQDKAMDIILEMARADNRVLSDPEPWVRVTNLGESSVDITARLWCRSEDYWELKFALTKAVKLAFDQNGISIPYPHAVEIVKQG